MYVVKPALHLLQVGQSDFLLAVSVPVMTGTCPTSCSCEIPLPQAKTKLDIKACSFLSLDRLRRLTRGVVATGEVVEVANDQGRGETRRTQGR